MDEKYILGLRKGSHADFNKLYDLYADRLYGFAYNLTHSSEMAEEIVQEVFLKIWQIWLKVSKPFKNWPMEIKENYFYIRHWLICSPIISDTSMELFTLHILLMMFIVYWRPIIFCWITKMNLWKVNLFGSIFFLILKSIFLTTQTFRYGK